LESPAQRGSTPLDSPKGEKGMLSVVSSADKRVPERGVGFPNTVEGELKRGYRPSYRFPRPSLLEDWRV